MQTILARSNSYYISGKEDSQMKRAKKMILSILCVSVLLCMTACARGNKDNVADDNTATGTNEENKNDSERKREETNTDGEAPRDNPSR